MKDDYTEVEEFIFEAFEKNYQVMRVEASRALTPDGKAAALEQVRLYWKRMQDLAKAVTETEVKLSLPNQTSPGGHEFSIHGVVDIVRDDDRTIMYDIKTHDAAYVRAHTEFYAEQLNVYAHIWQELRDEPLSSTAVIATQFPSQVAQALASGNEEYLEAVLATWDPLVSIPFDQERVEATIEEFGRAIDAIEEGEFEPPPLARLLEIEYRNESFARHTCRQCDARYSCDSYRAYLEETYGRDARTYRRYLGNYGTDEEREAWHTANIPDEQTREDLLEPR